MTDTIRTHTDAPTPFTIRPETWMVDAACATTDPDMFFPDPGDAGMAARRICAGCDVTDQCLEYAIRNNETHGIYGGLPARTRQKLIRKDKP